MMRLVFVTAPVLLPLLGGLFMLVSPSGKSGKAGEQRRLLYMEAVVLTASALVWALILTREEGEREAVLFYLAGNDLKVFFRLDGAGVVFAGLVSLLWPFATLYASDYIEGDERQKRFLAFNNMSY